MPLLSPGSAFPAISLTQPGETTLVPVLQCAVAAFQRAAGSLAETGIRVAALSVDDEPPPPSSSRSSA
jgi:hypothetical protein